MVIVLNTGCPRSFQILSKDFPSSNLAIRKCLYQKDTHLESFHLPSLSGNIIFTCQNFICDPLPFPCQHLKSLLSVTVFLALAKALMHFSSPSFQFLVCLNETILFIVALNIQLQSCTFSKRLIFLACLSLCCAPSS